MQVCTQFTDDDKVFAVIGNLSDAAQDAAIHTCIAKKHNTPVMTFDLTDAMIAQAPPGMLIFPGSTPERSSTVLFELMQKENLLQGKKLAVLASQTSRGLGEVHRAPRDQEDRGRDRDDRLPDDQRHRHDRRPEPARQLHRTLEVRGRERAVRHGRGRR